jgi:hypothetical protein
VFCLALPLPSFHQASAVLVPESAVDVFTRIGNGAEGVVHLAILRTTVAGGPITMDVVAKVNV